MGLNVFVTTIVLYLLGKQARNPVTVDDCKFNRQTGGVTDWPTDGRRVQYLSKYVLRCKKGTLKNPGKYFQNPSNHFWKKNVVVQWKRVGLHLLYHFWNQRGNSEQNGNVQIFVYINSNCVFIKTIWRKKTVAQWRLTNWRENCIFSKTFQRKIL